MPIIRFGLQSGRSLDFGKITESKSKLRWLGVSNWNFDTDQTVYQQAVSAPWSLPLVPYSSFNPYVTFPPQLCRNVSVVQDQAAPRKFIIEATYSSEPLKQSDDNQAQNPLLRPPTVEWGSQGYRISIDRDRNGQALVNSAGDYFDPPIEADRFHWVISISKNVQLIPGTILEYAGAINQTAFQISGVGIGARAAKLVDVGLSEKKSEGDGQNRVNFYTFSYSMECRFETWQLKVLDQGYRYKSGISIRQILTDDTPPRPVSSPRLLNGSGGILSNPSPSTAIYKTFDIDVEKDFSVLPGLLEAANA